MRFSLKHKAVLIIIALALVLSAISIIVSVRFVSNIIRNNYEKEATNLSRTVAAVVDAGAVERLRGATEDIYDSIAVKVGGLKIKHLTVSKKPFLQNRQVRHIEFTVTVHITAHRHIFLPETIQPVFSLCYERADDIYRLNICRTA